MRCVKPNSKQCSDIFSDDYVLFQLVSSCCIAYQQLMRNGFPDHLNIDHIYDVFKANLDYCKNTFDNRKIICSEIIRSCGLKWVDFKVGNTKFFFRNGKLDVLTQKMKLDQQIIIGFHKKLRQLRAKWRKAIIVIRMCSICKIQQNKEDSMNDAMDFEVYAIEKPSPKKVRKRKLNAMSDVNSCQSANSSAQTSSIIKY